MHDFNYENKMIYINKYHRCAHFINIHNSSSVFIFWKWGETSSTTSLLLIRTSSN